jgi:hypothetical protein
VDVQEVAVATLAATIAVADCSHAGLAMAVAQVTAVQEIAANQFTLTVDSHWHQVVDTTAEWSAMPEEAARVAVDNSAVARTDDCVWVAA